MAGGNKSKILLLHVSLVATFTYNLFKPMANEKWGNILKNQLSKSAVSLVSKKSMDMTAITMNRAKPVRKEFKT